MSDVLARLEKDPGVISVHRMELTALDGQAAFVKFSRREPRISGTSITSMGRSNSVTTENVGYTLGVTPRVAPDGAVTLSVDVEWSEIANDEEGVVIAEFSKENPTRTFPTRSTTMQSTISLREGEVVTLSGSSVRRADRNEQTVCYVSARSVRPGDNAGRRGVPRPSEARRPRPADRPAEEMGSPYTPRPSDTRSPSTRRPLEPRRRAEVVPSAEPVRPTN
jgi:hypothetical protein